MSGRLPLELVHVIFDHLRPHQWLVSWPNAADNKAALASCSLVSKSWNAEARCHLFRDVVYSFRKVPTGDEAFREGRVCKHEVYRRFSGGKVEEARYKTLRMFCTFLRSNWVARISIHRLRLRALPSAWRLNIFGSSAHHPNLAFDEQDCVEAKDLMDLLDLLPSLRALYFYDIIPTSPFCVKEGKPRGPPFSPKRVSIVFGRSYYSLRDRSQWTTYCEHATTRLLTFFNEVEDLYISRIGFDGMPPYAANLDIEVPSVQIHSLALAFFVPKGGFLFRRLAETSILSNLCQLVLEPTQYSPEEMSMLQSLLSVASSNLRELRYNLSNALFSRESLLLCKTRD